MSDETIAMLNPQGNASLCPDEADIKLLLIDDDQDELFLLRRELENSGFTIIAHTNSQDTLSLIEQEQPHLVLLDIQMPILNGIEVCTQIRQYNKYKELPVLMLTGSDGLYNIQLAFDAGATDFIFKSTNLGFISQRIKYLLRNLEHTRGLYENHEQLVKVQKVAKIGHWQLTVNSCELQLSDEALSILGLQGGEFENTLVSYLDLISLSDRDDVKMAIEAAIYDGHSFNVDHRIMRKDGSECYVNSQGEVVFDSGGKAQSMLGVIQDITERKRSEAYIEHQAFYDSLTELYNRRLFQDRLVHAMAQAKRQEKLLALCFFDLDSFKSINDTLGHAVGDELLKAIAKLLRYTMRQDDVVARISGDEFAIAIAGLNTVEELEKILTKLQGRLAERYRIRGHRIFATASIGVSLYPVDSNSREKMMRNADAAMYRAKSLGGNRFCYYTYDMSDRARRHLQMEKSLSKALQRNEITVYYQPQIGAQSGDVIGVEALLRWKHPELGLLYPAKFINLAEDSGQIIKIGRWVIEQACIQLARWQKMGGRQLRMSVNMSARQLIREDFVTCIENILHKTGIDPCSLCLEVSEATTLKSIVGAIETLHQLKAMGVCLSLDDFGMGNASMKVLQRLPIDTLNIDRSFVMSIGERQQDGATARAIIAMAHSLELKVVAEGVETDAQMKFLQEQNCDFVQGNFICPAVPRQQLEEFLSNHHAIEVV